MSTIVIIGAAVAWALFGPSAPPTGYVGRDGKYDVYCGYKPNTTDYDCQRVPAVVLPSEDDED